MTQLAAPPPRPATEPAAAGSSALMTVEAFRGEPDHEAFELIDGRKVERSVSYKSAWIGGQFFWHFQTYANEHGGHACQNGAEFRCFGDTRLNMRKPDATYIAGGRLAFPPDGPCEIPPDVAVEVISPTDTADAVDKKRMLYLASGVRCVLVVHPASRTVDVWRESRCEVLFDTDTLELPEVMPGLRIPLTTVFPPAEADPVGELPAES